MKLEHYATDDGYIVLGTHDEERAGQYLQQHVYQLPPYVIRRHARLDHRRTTPALEYTYRRNT